MLQKIREGLSIGLLALLPLHAFLITVATRFLSGPNQAPIVSLALWKECVLVLIVFIALLEIFSNRSLLTRAFRFDLIDMLIVALIVLAVIVTFVIGTDLTQALYGAKYDFTALLAFLVLRRADWSVDFLRKSITAILSVTILIIAFGLTTYFVPQTFFTWLGYSDLHSLYVADGPIAAFQYLPNGLRRLQSTLSGPNQLGIWLLLPWSIVLSKLLQTPKSIGLWLLLALIDLSLFLTFSRSAWIAASVIFVLVAILFVRERKIRLSKKRLLSIGIVLLILVSLGGYVGRDILFRTLSTRHHLTRPIEAMQKMIAYPFGQGLGTAGPASNRISDTCVFLEAGADPSWATDRPELCVFVDSAQVQPTEPCSCPFLPENWYLQIGVELGWIGFVFFLALTLTMLLKLRKNVALFSAFLGVSIAALFLHAWEDGAITYSMWLLSAAFLTSVSQSEKHQ